MGEAFKQDLATRAGGRLSNQETEMITGLSFPKAILFDWDNTLVDTELGIFDALNAVLQEFGKQPYTWEVFCNQPALSMRTYFKTIFPPEHLEKAEQLFRAYAVNLPYTPFVHAEPLLKWIQARGLPMAVVSNKQGHLLRKEISELGWEAYFYSAVGSYDTEEDKPSPRPLLYALAQQSLKPGLDIWFVGDSEVDMRCAHHAGCVPISVGKQADASVFPAARLQDCEGVYRLLKELEAYQTPQRA